MATETINEPCHRSATVTEVEADEPLATGADPPGTVSPTRSPLGLAQNVNRSQGDISLQHLVKILRTVK